MTVSCSKGGIGKTALALALALEWKDFGYGTNETFHELDKILGNERVLSSSPFEEFPDFASEQIDVIFDLSGDVHEKSLAVASAIEQSNVVLVPVTIDSKAIHSAANFIMTIAPMNTNIILVANILEKQKGESFDSWEQSHDYMVIRNSLNEKLPDEFHELPMLPIKSTKAFKTIEKERKSLKELMNSNPLLRYSYKEVNQQIEAIMELVKSYE
ncbi:P-loop NTPase family protein [Thiomicrorhabdus hydrogeniphila]